MSDFHQNGIITTLHNFNNLSKKTIEEELKKFSKKRPIHLILPSLFSELKRPALKKIILELNKVNYISEVIIGLDQANENEFKYSKKFFKSLKIPHTILWNDGPKLLKLNSELENINLAPKEFGKGRNVWYCLGYSISTDKAEAIAIHDCDIVTYTSDILSKLIYPIVNPNLNFEFCKGYYPRVYGNKMSGRASRLLVTPLIKSLKKIIGQNEYLDFMDSFRYPLAGECSFRKRILRDLKIPSDWGLEIGILSEMHRNYRNSKICQIDIADKYEHKHQDLSDNDINKGLSKMSIDISKTFIRKLATQGHIFSLETFRTLKATYLRTALDYVEIYKKDAIMNNILYDEHTEEKAVDVFSENIMKAGEIYLGLPLDTPFIPTWNRVESAKPDFLKKLKKAVEYYN